MVCIFKNWERTFFPNLANTSCTNYTQTYISSVGKIHKGGDDFSRKCTPRYFVPFLQFKQSRYRRTEISSVSDPYHFDFDLDPDPRIRIRDDGSGSGSEVTFENVNRIFPIKCYARL